MTSESPQHSSATAPLQYKTPAGTFGFRRLTVEDSDRFDYTGMNAEPEVAFRELCNRTCVLPERQGDDNPPAALLKAYERYPKLPQKLASALLKDAQGGAVCVLRGDKAVVTIAGQVFEFRPPDLDSWEENAALSRNGKPGPAQRALCAACLEGGDAQQWRALVERWPKAVTVVTDVLDGLADCEIEDATKKD